MAKQKMNTETLVKKLKAVSNTQDSIPMLSLWIIHHKAHHKLIVDQWLQVLKHSKSPHRLTLLYLCNDVIQNCHRKNADIFKETFCDVLPEAITLLRDMVIRPNVERVVKIWSKRKVLDCEITDQLIAALVTNKPPQKLRNKLLVEYKTANLISEIQKFKDLEDEIETEQQRLRAMRVDVSNYDAIRKLKDKIGGERFSKDFEESATQLEIFLKRYDKFVERRKHLLELLDQGSVYYHAQYHEAKIVVNAYKSFEGRVNKMKRGLEKVKSTLPVSHATTFGSDLMPSLPAHNNTEEDMEMSDDDKELGSKPSKIVAVNTSLLKPIQKASSEKTTNNENVLKLLATGLESIKSTSSEIEKEDLRKAVTGLISRPGMRGASTSKTSNTTVKSDSGNMGSLTITRSIEQPDFDSSRPGLQNDIDITIGSESPPSPTDSPELNISSPPRHQSLDSRLADLFRNTTPGDAEKPASDTESDTGDAAKVLDDKKEDQLPSSSLLPGLGGLNEIKTSLPGFADDSTVLNERQKDAMAHGATTGARIEKSISQAIPVIGGGSAFRAPTSSVPDGASTPTLDETPFNIQTDLPTDLNFGAGQSFLSPPRFSGDALSFLSKFMGQATNTEIEKAENAIMDKVSANSRDASHEEVWKTAESTQANDKTYMNSKQSWNTRMPSPPKPTVPVPPSWESLALARSNSFQSAVKTEPGLPLAIKHEYPGDGAGELPTKKGRWSDVGHEDANFRKIEGNPGAMEGRRNSNLITLSELRSEPKSSPVTTQQNTSSYEPMSHFREILRRKSEEQPSQPAFHNQKNVAENSVPPKEMAKQQHESESDDNVMHVSSHAVIVGTKGNLQDFEHSVSYSTSEIPVSSVYVASDSQDEEAFAMDRDPYANPHLPPPPLPHQQTYEYEEEHHHGNGYNAPVIRGPPSMRFPPPHHHPHPREAPPPPRPPIRRTFVDEERLGYELSLLEEERQRDAAMMESIHSHERRPMRPARYPVRPPPRIRMRHPVPHARPRFLGGPRPPRMRYY